MDESEYNIYFVIACTKYIIKALYGHKIYAPTYIPTQCTGTQAPIYTKN